MGTVNLRLPVFKADRIVRRLMDIRRLVIQNI